MTPAAIMSGTSSVYFPTNWVMITVRGWVCSLLAKMSGMVNSPHVARKRMAVSAAMPGRISGMTMRRKAWKRVQPSTLAASSSSTGSSRT